MTRAQQLQRRRADNHQASRDPIKVSSPGFGQPIAGDKSAACLARIARRKQVRARRNEFAATMAKQRAEIVPNKYLGVSVAIKVVQ